MEPDKKTEQPIEVLRPATQALPPLVGPNTRVRIEDLQGLFKSISSVPTHSPRNFYEQIVFYKNGATYRLYFYVEDSWHYASLT